MIVLQELGAYCILYATLYANDLLKIDNFSIRKHEKGIECEASLCEDATGCSAVALKFIF